MKRIYLYVDDIRDFKGNLGEEYVLVTARSYGHAIDAINFFYAEGCEFFIDLDHDLGREKSGYDIAKYIVENELDGIKWRVHSMNPVGRDNIAQLLSHYGYEEF